METAFGRKLYLHVFHRFDAKQIQMFTKNLTHKRDQGQPALFFYLVRLVDDMVVMVKFRKGIGQLISVFAQVIRRFFRQSPLKYVAAHKNFQQQFPFGIGINASERKRLVHGHACFL